MIKENTLANFWVSLCISILVGGLLALIFNSMKLAMFAVGFAVTREVMSGISTHFNKQSLSKEKIDILRKFASEMLGQTRFVVEQKNVSSIIQCLATLEYILTEISNCCGGNVKNKFKRIKGLVSDTKTTFDKSQYDISIKKPYADAITVISNIETYLVEL